MSQKLYNGKVVKNFRLEENDSIILKKILDDNNTTMQVFFEACVKAYLRGDPNIMKVLKDFLLLRDVSKEDLAGYVISTRERTSLLDEFEKKRKL